jgi:hypothetical protein
MLRVRDRCSKGCDCSTGLWIPAFEGMTVFRLTISQAEVFAARCSSVTRVSIAASMWSLSTWRA